MTTGPNRLTRVRGFVARHRLGTAFVSLAATVIVVFLLLWFTPWRLFTDVVVDEALPMAQPSSSQAARAPSGPTVLSTGSFRDLEHDTDGTANILELADGSRVLRLERFRTSNGPDVVVMLSATPATEDRWGAYDDDDHVLLGRLKGTIGAQNYVIPSTVDLKRYRSVVIWCRRFTVGFGAAPLTLA